jgi:hypothetical protein
MDRSTCFPIESPGTHPVRSVRPCTVVIDGTMADARLSFGGSDLMDLGDHMRIHPN